MLDQTTKRKLDSARQILVGKVPDPKAQVEQITTALVYKFMDDMDKESEELGGEAKFFANGFSQYAWTKLLDNKLSGQERLDLYVQAITNMSKNPHIPQLFRDIFKGAFLPYNDPRTLSLFLKEINEFNYEHSENLGNAFEYLLSILGSQGDAGQFRTPRHIIDFIVEVVDPKKNETILDPACGTAGFLISAYKHILKTNKEKPLTPDEKLKLMNNLAGYDISPDMVKLALVNMYLHGFPEPKIHEYDSLTSEKRWDETFDVILANPPFMTPKGGIVPHKKFSIQSNKAEVLFVNYIIEHLNINGRAGVIVPEGVVFQSPNAYKELRKLLIDGNYLFAVVSMPAGVFQPYSGVKTSILFLDREIARKNDSILFAKVEKDGFSLGAKRNIINENDLPTIADNLKKFKQGTKIKAENINTISKDKIKKSSNYSLLLNSHQEEIEYKDSKYSMIPMGEVADFKRGPFGSSIKKSVCVPKGTNTFKVYEQGNIINNDFERGSYYLPADVFEKLEQFELIPGDIAITCAGTIGKIAIAPKKMERGIINSVLMRIRVDESKINRKYFLYIFGSSYLQKMIMQKSTGVAVTNLFATKELKKFKIPLPALKEQEKIVAEIDNKKKKIDDLYSEIKEQNNKIDQYIENIWSS